MAFDATTPSMFAMPMMRGSATTDDRFPDPFTDIASAAMPQTPAEANRWCEFIVSRNHTYRQAIQRIVSYFVTDVMVSQKGTQKLSNDVRDKYRKFFNDEIGVRKLLVTIGKDFLTYGNSFTSLMLPFKRHLRCKKCHFEAPFRKIHETAACKFRWADFEFVATCPNCRNTGVWKHVDRRITDTRKIKVKRWSPHEIKISFEPTHEHREYIWEIPETDKAEIKRGNLHYLEHTNWEVIQCVKENKNLKFDNGAIFHMCEPAFAGLRARGWGVSQVLTNFTQAWYVQMLKRQNEAICLDFIVPTRVITPVARQGGSGDTNDPLATINGNSFRGAVETMLKKRRQDPARWNVLPYPVEYQMFGGEANQLAPKELIEQAENSLLNGIGAPVEFYQGTLTVQAAPAALRLFEAAWSHLVHSLNEFLSDLSEQLAEALSWEPAKVQLERVTHADDLNRQMAKLQLMMSGQVSKTTGLRSIGLEYGDELQRSLDEQIVEATSQSKAQEELESTETLQQVMQQMQAGQGQPGQPGQAAAGQPAPGQPGMMPPSALDLYLQQKVNNPNVPVTPQDLQGQAQAIAQDLLARSDPERRSALVKLRQSDETMATLVQRSLDKQRYDARMQGGQMLMNQQKAASLRQLIGHDAFVMLAKSATDRQVNHDARWSDSRLLVQSHG